MSDAYNDELYNPSFAVTSAPLPRSLESTTTTSTHQSDVFSQRLQAANSQHLSAASASQHDFDANIDRDRSPFRQGSPLAPTSNTFAPVNAAPVRLGSAAKMREQQKAENDARVLQQQIQRTSPQQIASQTISPKEAMLDYHETDEDAKAPLFPPQPRPTSSRPPDLPLPEPSQSDIEDTASQRSYRSMATTRRESSSYSNSSQPAQQGSGFTFVPPAVPGSARVPQQYPFAPQQRREASSLSSATDKTLELPTLTSMESTGSEFAPESEIKRPERTNADIGTYTCTYHGCTLRFETPTKLQKHKREGHRQSVPATAGVKEEDDRASSEDIGSDMTSEALRNSQAGPHTCRRINPSTGKACNTVFSRPYDLTRHEDTIHNARKQKVRCQLCTEEKTFSRNDALTRHMRVVHPDVDFPGKTRRGKHD